nr:hypothetical protein [Streptomyces arboris]
MPLPGRGAGRRCFRGGGGVAGASTVRGAGFCPGRGGRRSGCRLSDLVRGPDRGPVALPPARLPALEHRLRLLRQVGR